jgi:hypothetical protein
MVCCGQYNTGDSCALTMILLGKGSELRFELMRGGTLALTGMLFLFPSGLSTADLVSVDMA